MTITSHKTKGEEATILKRAYVLKSLVKGNTELKLYSDIERRCNDFDVILHLVRRNHKQMNTYVNLVVCLM